MGIGYTRVIVNTIRATMPTKIAFETSAPIRSCMMFHFHLFRRFQQPKTFQNFSPIGAVVVAGSTDDGWAE